MSNIPPHDEFAEEAILSELCMRPDEVFDRVSVILKPEYFFANSRKLIYECVEELQRAGTHVDFTAIATALKDKNQLAAVGGTQYLLTLVNTVPSAILHLEQHALTIRDKWRLRQAVALFQAKAAEAFGGNLGGDQQWLETIEADLSVLVHDLREQTTVTLGTVVSQLLSQLQGPAEEASSKSGLLDLDKMIHGFYDGDLIVIAARPSIGKSTLGQNLALNISHPEEVATLIVSPEMPREQVAMRMLSCDSKIEYGKFRARAFTPADWPTLTAAVDRLGKRPIWINDTASITVLEIRAIARQLARAIEQQRAERKAKRLGLVVVDYLQLVKGIQTKSSNREQEVASVSRDLKAMAKELHVPVIAIAALNREVERRSGKEKRPKMSDLRETGSTEYDADTVILMDRPDYYDRADRPGQCDLIIGKQRNGPTGTVTVQYDKAYMKFNNFIHGEVDTGAGSEWFQDM